MDESLKLSDRLAAGRTILAMDRTLMAWVRTALSLISFGFTIYKFLGSLETQGRSLAHATSPRNIGLFLTTIGTLSLGMALWQFWVTMERKLGVSRREMLLNPTVWLASMIWLFGAINLLGILTRLI